MWTNEDSYAALGRCLDWNASKSYVSGLNIYGLQPEFFMKNLSAFELLKNIKTIRSEIGFTERC